MSTAADTAFVKHNKIQALDPMCPIYATPIPFVWKNGYDAALKDILENTLMEALANQRSIDWIIETIRHKLSSTNV